MPDEKGKFTEVTFKIWCVGVENRNFFGGRWVLASILSVKFWAGAFAQRDPSTDGRPTRHRAVLKHIFLI